MLYIYIYTYYYIRFFIQGTPPPVILDIRYTDESLNIIVNILDNTPPRRFPLDTVNTICIRGMQRGI